MNDIFWLATGWETQRRLRINFNFVSSGFVKRPVSLTICAAVEVQIEGTLITACREDPPVCGQHIEVHINLLYRLPNVQIGEPIPFSADISKQSRTGLRTMKSFWFTNHLVADEVARCGVETLFDHWSCSRRWVKLEMSGAGKLPPRLEIV
jgi:hypothetical protein